MTRLALAATLLAGCGPEEPLRVAFDTEVANVARVWLADDRLDEVRWEDRVGVDRLVGLPQGETLVVTGHRDGEEVARARVDVPRTGLPDLQILHSTQDAWMAGGHVAAAVLDEQKSGIAVYDGRGRVVWGWKAPDDDVAASPIPSRDGTDLLAFFSHRDRNVDDARVRRIPLDGRPITDTPVLRGHHTFHEREDGTFLWLSREFPVVDMTPLGIDDSWTVMTDTVRDEQGIVFDLAEYEPLYHPCTHFDTVHQRYGLTGVHDWSHANSLVHDPTYGELLVGVRLHDSIVALDPATGAPLWKATGDWSHAHFSDVQGGRILLFDNGTHRDPPASRVIELAIDRDTGSTSITWDAPQPDGGFTAWLGDARYLPNGNRLLAFTTLGRIQEHTPEGVVVWDAQLPSSYVGRIRAIELP